VRHEFVVKRALTLLFVGALVAAGCGSDEESPPVGAVEVTVQEVEDLSGGQVAGVLYRGEGLEMPDVRVVGGFGVAIDADPFSATELVRVGQDSIVESTGLFPYVTEEVLTVEPGAYTLMMWAADSPMGPYSRWVPGGPESLIGCSTIFEFEEGQSASLTVVDGLGDVSFGPPSCTVATTTAVAGEPTTAETTVIDVSATRRFTLTPVEWSASNWGASMIVEASPLDAQDVAAIGASLIWEETTITLTSSTHVPSDLANIAIREIGDGYVHIGDIFGFDERPDLEEAAANHGPPSAACIYVDNGWTVRDHCAPLTLIAD
jgi:hypothetical protein